MSAPSDIIVAGNNLVRHGKKIGSRESELDCLPSIKLSGEIFDRFSFSLHSRVIIRVFSGPVTA